MKSYLEYICGAQNVAEFVPLSSKTSFKIGGAARFFVNTPTKECLVRLVSALDYVEYPYRVIGSGANLLASDKGYGGIVIRPTFKEIIENQCFIYADAGASLAAVCRFSREHELSGLEWAAGIPATIGGAVFMNAGAHGSEMKDIVAMVDILADGEIKTLDTNQLKFEYRKSIFHKHRDWIILGAYFLLKNGTKEEIITKERELLAKRTAAQPKEPSAGSVFKKPHDNFFVGAEIEKLGLKGTQIGGAQISPKHAGFIVNTGGATAKDVLKLIALIKKKIYDAHGIRLQTEIETLGL